MEKRQIIAYCMEMQEQESLPVSKRLQISIMTGGLRLIEIYKHQFCDLNDVITQIKNRNYKFIIYMDDLSFEEFEIEYKYLKAVIEGGLEKKPDNVLIYATSNRRHLIRENFSDKEEIRQDMHTSDTVQEKLSLTFAANCKRFWRFYTVQRKRSSRRAGLYGACWLECGRIRVRFGWRA